MLLISSRIVILLFITLLLTSCSKKKYYSSGYYKKTNSYKKLKNQNMKNSKAMHRATMRSYVVHGKRYTPEKTYIGEEFEGIASWYGPNFHSKLTSNGENYNMYASTAASKTLPMNTMLKVYNLENKTTTIVRINDRGPFIKGRIIDLSNKAAHDIDMVKNGTANIRIKVIGFNGEISKIKIQKNITKFETNYYIQIGVFSKIEGAKSTARKFNLILKKNNKAIIKQEKLNGQRINRVLINGFKSYEDAENYKNLEGLNQAIIIAH